ncbi:MAG: response regulator [Magnetococcales bacterium]|nr:response regulator [Magnetococcales bacterium]
MPDPFRGLLGGCQTPMRFFLGLALIGLGETAVTVLLFPDHGGLISPVMLLTHFLCMTAWNLLIILIFFHLPLFRELRDRQWIHATHHALSRRMRDVGVVQSLGEMTLQFLLEHLGALNGVIYLAEEGNRLQWLSGIGIPSERELSQTLEPGEGLLGQVAITRKPVRLKDVPVEPLRLKAELLAGWPRDLIITPLIHDDQLQGVLALGNRELFQDRHRCFLERAGETIARAIAGVRANAVRQQLLEESRMKTQELAINQQVLRDTIELLEQTSGFKSRFLANMSHELRSPLNSLLILAQLLKENKQGNLTPKQVEFASTIHAAGSDLLTMIDEILDLARIEAGRIRVFKDPVKLSELAIGLERLFVHVAREKKLDFEVLLQGMLPVAIRTDRMRVEQILKNLITNAIKFTHAGGVTVTIRPVPDGVGTLIAMSVADTGVGIPRDQHAEVFEPFRQLDDGSNRKYGGSGLGLAISKELAQLLGGRIELVSEQGQGSLFTLYLPLESVESSPLPQATPVTPRNEERNQGIDAIPDDRRRLGPDDRSVLLVGMDYHRIRAIGEAARVLGLGVIVAGDQSAALFLANFLRPVGLIMVGDLPGVATFPLVKRLRTTADRDALPALYLHPANATLEIDGAAEEVQLVPLLRESDQTSPECQRFLQSVLAVPAACALEDSGADPTRDRGGVGFPSDPLLKGHPAVCNLVGRRVLLIDDDIRNIFALTSFLEEQGCQVIMAESGRVGMERLRQQPLLDMVLMDIMLPDMNGYDWLGEIRRQPAWRHLPLLVLTAKAMQGERQRCLEAGASDYLSKPVDTLKLLSMMRPWLDKNR